MARELIARLRENACIVHETDCANAPATIVDRVAEHANARAGPIAVAPADPVVAELDLVPRFLDRGLEVLLPDMADWHDALPGAAVGVTGAALAVTEPAALAVVAQSSVPRAISLLPPVHICVLRTADVVDTLAEALARFEDALPSALTWIGGPSRTGDLEMVQTLGVHGPIVVEVVIIESADAAERSPQAERSEGAKSESADAAERSPQAERSEGAKGDR
jgi:L-lactate dehydrogenase complex protein LldG